MARTSQFQDKLAKKIAGAVFKLQYRFVAFLSARTANLSPRSLQLVMVAACTCWCIVSSYLMASAFIPGKANPAINISHINHSSAAIDTSKRKLTTEFLITDGEYQEVKQFRNYMDSLQQNAQPLYYNILLRRPALMDSILLLERIYEEHKNKSHE